jgi:hypothetical protein
MSARGGGSKRLSTKRKFVADGVFYSELNELLIVSLFVAS